MMTCVVCSEAMTGPQMPSFAPPPDPGGIFAGMLQTPVVGSHGTAYVISHSAASSAASNSSSISMQSNIVAAATSGTSSSLTLDDIASGLAIAEKYPVFLLSTENSTTSSSGSGASNWTFFLCHLLHLQRPSQSLSLKTLLHHMLYLATIYIYIYHHHSADRGIGE